MTTILVTGGAGFIGSRFVEYMIDNTDYDIVCLDALKYSGSTVNLFPYYQNCHSKFKFIKGDITDLDVVVKAMKGADYVVNFAAETHVDNSIKDPLIFTYTNVMGTHALLEAAKELGIKRFLQVSTDEVYGSIKEGFFTEDSPIKPNSPYSASKAAADLLVQAYHTTFKLDTVITRCSNNYGSHQYHEKLIPHFVDLLKQGKHVTLYGDGSNVRDWLQVFDHCSAIHKVLEEGVSGEVYNIGCNNELTNLEVTKIILDVMGLDESYIDFVEDRKGHDFRYAIDSTKLRKLGWEPTYLSEYGIAATARWYASPEYDRYRQNFEGGRQ